MWANSQTAPPYPLLIASGSSCTRTAAPLNHRIYADRMGVPYLYDSAPSSISRVSFLKVDLLRRILPLAEWVFWIDDDAFFTDLSIDLRTILSRERREQDLIFCRSPINPRGKWAWMSAGQFFIRRSPAMFQLLDAVLLTDLDVVRAWWRTEEYGIFTNGDQEAFVYQLMGPDQRWRDRFVRLSWEVFNSRPYHYQTQLNEHFVCHFAVPGGRRKEELIAEFAERMRTTRALCDAALFEPYRAFLERSPIGPIVGVTPPAALRPRGLAALARAAARRAARAIRSRVQDRPAGRG